MSKKNHKRRFAVVTRTESPTLSEIVRSSEKSKLRPYQGAPLETPEVIQLPHLTAKAAQEVQENSDIPPGPVSKLTARESADLLSAATMGRNDPVDAEFTAILPKKEIPDAELAAGEILRETVDAETDTTGSLSGDSKSTSARTNEDSPPSIDSDRINAEKMFDGIPEPLHVKLPEFMYHALSDGAQKLLDDFKQMQLRMIAFGNDVMDFFEKQMAAFNKWKADIEKRIIEWALKAKAEYVEYMELVAAATQKVVDTTTKDDDENRPLTKACFKMLMEEHGQLIADREENTQKELRRLSKRVTDLEKANEKLAKAQRKANQTMGNVDGETLKLFVQAMSDKRKAQAVNLYRALTGAELGDAKTAVESMAAA